MIWTSKEIKKKGMSGLESHFLQAFVITFVLKLLLDLPALLFQIDWSKTISVAQSFAVLIVLLAVLLFLYIPLSAGRDKFFLSLLTENVSFSSVGYFFSHGAKVYFSIIKNISLRWLSILAWGLCLFVPGVMRYYSTFFMSKILAQNPNLTAAQAANESKKFTASQRMNLFVMQLTFIGWILLSAFVVYRFTLILPYSLGRIISAAVFALPAAYYQVSVSALLLKFEENSIADESGICPTEA